jgi:hypothetical protein
MPLHANVDPRLSTSWVPAALPVPFPSRREGLSSPELRNVISAVHKRAVAGFFVEERLALSEL